MKGPCRLLAFIWATMMLEAVKKENFRRCDELKFCSDARRRAGQSLLGRVESEWSVGSKIEAIKGGIGFELIGGKNRLNAELSILEGHIVKFHVDVPGGGRYQIPKGDVIMEGLSSSSLSPIMPTSLDHWSFAFGQDGGGYQVRIELKPFKLVVLDGVGDVLAELNGQGLFNYNQSTDTDKSDKTNTDNNDDSRSEDEEEDVLDDESIGCDILFAQDRRIWGLAEHTAGLALRPTWNGTSWTEDPYRLYNLDVFEYELDSTMALYGSVPWMLGRRVGVLWNNPSETWVDLLSRNHASVVSESGVMEVYLVVGDRIDQVLGGLGKLVGFPAMPPLWSLGYHQCRWNYKSQADLLQVHQRFDEEGIPLDVLWLDIEHTDGKRYFTWDQHAFPDPEEMQAELKEKGRHLINIVDPHIKADEGYYVYDEMVKKGFAVMNKDGQQPFHGHCWPGESVWADFTNPAVRAWWGQLYAPDRYLRTDPATLHIWNDMNEPSVFNGPETTMPKHALHQPSDNIIVKHRDLHNLYGQYMHRATYEGLLARSSGKERPFVLSRAFYAGTQRWGPIWTGDNAASWDHLAASIPMLLQLGLCGLPWVGADVGGFFGDPEPELLVRWYQTGALYPFFRAHAHIDTKRREPWVVGQPYLGLIKEAILLRYQLLPYLYTLFYESTITGMPLLRPMFFADTDGGLEDVEDQFFLGPALLHKPVTKAAENRLTVALPEGSLWYDYFTLDPLPRTGSVGLEMGLERMALFLAAGSIIPLKMRQRRSSKAMKGDPFTLLIALDPLKQAAQGTVYIDDGLSFDFEEGAAIYRRLAYHPDGTLSCAPAESYVHGRKHLDTRQISTSVEAIVVTGFKAMPKSAKLVNSAASHINLVLEQDSSAILRIRKPPVFLDAHWTIQFTF